MVSRGALGLVVCLLLPTLLLARPEPDEPASRSDQADKEKQESKQKQEKATSPESPTALRSLGPALQVVPFPVAYQPPGTQELLHAPLPTLDPIRPPSWTAAGGDALLRFRVDYLYWWQNGSPLPSRILTTSNSKILAGRQYLDYPAASGIRLAFDTLCIQDQEIAWEGNLFMLEKSGYGRTIASDDMGTPRLSRPFRTVTDGSTETVPLARPDKLAGEMNISSQVRLQGGELNVTYPFFATEPYLPVRTLIGFRAMDLSESLRINTRSRSLVDGAANLAGTDIDKGGSIDVFDGISASNHFYGLNLGFQCEVAPWENVTLGMRARVAIGANQQHLDLVGQSTARNTPQGSVVVTEPAGMLVVGSNRGQQNVTRISYVPDVGMNAAWRVNEYVSVRMGYEWMYWTEVMRPGEQVDTVIKKTLIPTLPEYDPKAEESRPRVPNRNGEFWAHGLTLGVEVRY